MAMIRINHRRVTKDQLAVNVLGYILVGLFALLCVIPFYLIIVASFTDESSLIRNGYPLIPTDFSVQSYLLCLKNPTEILRAYGTTIGVTVVGTALAVYPAAGLIDYYKGNKLVLVNKTPTARDGAADLVVQGSIGEIFAAL